MTSAATTTSARGVEAQMTSATTTTSARRVEAR
jgi:hypothetical protein